MCRFLLVRSKNKIKPEKLLNEFALMCEKSRAPDGDWQGDGWGIALKDEKWEVYKSLKPIWQDKDKFQEFGETNIFAIHARSSCFLEHEGNIDFNQPFLEGDLCFVFNGMIRGVRIERKLKGIIGAQKIFSLIREESQTNDINIALRYSADLIIKNSQKVDGMNIGLILKDRFYVLSEYTVNAQYFSLHYFQNDLLTLICSEPFGSYDWKVIQRSDLKVL